MNRTAWLQDRRMQKFSRRTEPMGEEGPFGAGSGGDSRRGRFLHSGCGPRKAMEAERQRFTFWQTRRTVPITFSIMLVQASKRRNSFGNPSRVTVRISYCEPRPGSFTPNAQRPSVMAASPAQSRPAASEGETARIRRRVGYRKDNLRTVPPLRSRGESTERFHLHGA
jgi:hypothetical protein